MGFMLKGLGASAARMRIVHRDDAGHSRKEQRRKPSRRSLAALSAWLKTKKFHHILHSNATAEMPVIAPEINWVG